jgi:DNA invertase Pin-like site-specific DNA recombinase
MPRVISYLRFSNPEQMRGDSIRRQTKRAEEFCASRGWVLDDSYSDRGVSGYKGKNHTEGALSQFLALVQSGEVPAGTVLLIESLDRLTREEPFEAIALFSKIITAGVTIITLADGKTYDRNAVKDMGNMLYMVIVACRAHEESMMKADRLGRAWQQKRDQMSEGHKLTSVVPAWMKLTKGKLELIPDAVKTVKLIYELTIQGQGTGALAKHLNATNVPPIGRAKQWYNSYLQKILTNRAVLGEYQPMTGHHPNRKPCGPVVPDYYPAIIDEAVFFQVQEIRRSRAIRGNRGTSKSTRNLFSGLLRDYLNGGSLTMVDKGKKSSGPKLVSSKAMRGEKGAEYISIGYDFFEGAMLRVIQEIDWNKALAVGVPVESDLAELETKRAKLKAKVDVIMKSLDGDFDGFEEMMKKYKDFKLQLQDLDKLIEKTKGGAAQTNIVQSVRQLEGEDARKKAIVEIRKVIERIEIWIDSRDRYFGWIVCKGGYRRDFNCYRENKVWHCTIPDKENKVVPTDIGDYWTAADEDAQREIDEQGGSITI